MKLGRRQDADFALADDLKILNLGSSPAPVTEDSMARIGKEIGK
jgi:hypothetical protein